MKELIEYIARSLASDPDSVVVTESFEDGRIVFRLRLHRARKQVRRIADPLETESQSGRGWTCVGAVTARENLRDVRRLPTTLPYVDQRAHHVANLFPQEARALHVDTYLVLVSFDVTS